MIRTHTARPLVILTSLVALVAGCGGEERRDADARTGEGSRPSAVGETFSLEGCLRAGVTDQFVLDTIEIVAPEMGPRERAGLADRTGITEWAWVELEPGPQSLRPHLGQRVRVTGVLIRSGHNTIGTAGTWGYETPSGDKSQAASDEHYAEKQKLEMGRIARQSLANGTAPEVRVEQVHSTGDACLQPDAPEGR